MKVIETHIVCEKVLNNKSVVLAPKSYHVFRKAYLATFNDDNQQIRFFLDKEDKIVEITKEEFYEFKNNMK